MACTTTDMLLTETVLNTSLVHVSYMPLAHIFETITHCFVFSCGGRIAFYSGQLTALVGDFVTARPTILMGPPRIFQRFYEKAMGQSGMVGTVLRHALQVQSVRMRTAGAPTFGGFGTNVFKKVANKIGLANVRLVVVGGAPCPAYLMEFMQCLTGGGPVLQGYGMTESGGTISVCAPVDRLKGHVGPPIPGVHVRLRDVPHMGYLTTDQPPRGGGSGPRTQRV